MKRLDSNLENTMTDNFQRDELTPLERKVYRYVAYIAVGLSFYVMLLLRTLSGGNNVFLGVAGFVFLLIGIVFGWGCNKSIRVVDLRRFNK